MGNVVQDFSGNNFMVEQLSTNEIWAQNSSNNLIRTSGSFVPWQSGTDMLGTIDFPYKSMNVRDISGNSIKLAGQDIVVSGSNLGNGLSLFAGKVGNALQFNTFSGVGNISVSNLGNIVMVSGIGVVSGAFVKTSGDTMTGTLNLPVLSGNIISGNTISVGVAVNAQASGTINIGSSNMPFNQNYGQDWIRLKPSFAYCYQSGNAVDTNAFGSTSNFRAFSGTISASAISSDLSLSNQGLLYTGTPKYFTASLNCNLSNLLGSVSVFIGFQKNGSMVPGSMANTYLSLLNLPSPCNTMAVVQLTNGDVLTPVVRNSTNTNSVGTSYMNFTLTEV